MRELLTGLDWVETIGYVLLCLALIVAFYPLTVFLWVLGQ